jgi:hypothetical protein
MKNTNNWKLLGLLAASIAVIGLVAMLGGCASGVNVSPAPGVTLSAAATNAIVDIKDAEQAAGVTAALAELAASATGNTNLAATIPADLTAFDASCETAITQIESGTLTPAGILADEQSIQGLVTQFTASADAVGTSPTTATAIKSGAAQVTAKVASAKAKVTK